MPSGQGRTLPGTSTVFGPDDGGLSQPRQLYHPSRVIQWGSSAVRRCLGIGVDLRDCLGEQGQGMGFGMKSLEGREPDHDECAEVTAARRRGRHPHQGQNHPPIHAEGLDAEARNDVPQKG